MSDPTSLTGWLRSLVAHDALLAAWQSPGPGALADYEANALAIAALAGRSGTPATIVIPGGRARLPLLAAVHAATLRLPGFPSPFSGHLPGPAVLATRQTVRRDELAALDAAGVSISPALHPARLRADALIASLPSGHPRSQQSSDRLLIVQPSSSWARPTISPSTVIIDAADEASTYVDDALAWSSACGATAILFADVARHTWPTPVVLHPCGWSAIAAATAPAGTVDKVAALAPMRGHAAVLPAGARPELAAAAAVLADARRHRGSAPAVLIEAAVICRRLAELVVPIDEYDAACPRWRSPTLSERIEDLAEIGASDFPSGWGTWAQTCWASIKGGLLIGQAALKKGNRKAELLVETVDADLREGLAVDVALPSRTARDAVTRHLANAGVPMPTDGRLAVRSLADANAWGPPRVSLLTAPPTQALRHRMVAADVGPLNVLCYDHETQALRRALLALLDEPQAPDGRLRDLLPPALAVTVDLPAQRPEVLLSLAPIVPPATRRAGTSLSRLADAVDMSGLIALRAPAQTSLGPDDLPDADEPDAGPMQSRTRAPGTAVPIVVVVGTVPGAVEFLVNVPTEARVARLLNGRVHRLPALEVDAGMLLVGLDGVTPFDRLRPLLTEARGPVARMLLTAWDQALDMALRAAGGPAALTKLLVGSGAHITPATVATWTDEDRIGPQDRDNVIRVGQLANHPVVAGEATAIADVMRGLRLLHQAVGRALSAPDGMTNDAAADLERLLGPDALSLLAQTVVYRVVAVGPVAIVPAAELWRPMSGAVEGAR